MPKDLELSLLLDFYGPLLTEKQRTVFDWYYNEDLSLSEIAETQGISRQGVRDSIKRAEQQMRAMEDALGLAARFRRITEGLTEISEAARKLAKENQSVQPQADAIARLADELRRTENES